MKKFKPVYFPDDHRFVLTFPADDDLFDRVRSLESAEIRRLAGYETVAAIEQAAGKGNVRRVLRERLRARLAERDAEFPLRRTVGETRPSFWGDAERIAIAESLIERFAPGALTALDPASSNGANAVAAARKGARVTCCESDPVARFLALARFRALYRDDDSRRSIADDLRRLAGSFELHLARAAERHDDPLSQLSWIAAEARWSVSGVARDLFRAAVVSILPEEGLIDAHRSLLPSRLESLARSVEDAAPLQTFPAFLADDPADLAGMPSIGADLLITSPPALGTHYAGPHRAEEFLRLGPPHRRERPIARGRATALAHHDDAGALAALEHSPILERADARHARELFALLNSHLEKFSAPGKAATAARAFSSMIRGLAAAEEHLAEGATAIVDVADSSFGAALVPNATIVAGVLSMFRFAVTHAESIALRALPDRDGERRVREHRLIVMNRHARPRQQVDRDWAAWA